MARKKKNEISEYTVSGNDILSLVANIDERQEELKSKSENFINNHPELQPKEYDTQKSIPEINNVISNLFNKDNDMNLNLPEMEQEEYIKPKNVNDKESITQAEAEDMLKELFQSFDDVKNEENKESDIKEENFIDNQLKQLKDILPQPPKQNLDPEYLQIKERNVVPEPCMNEPNQIMRLKQWQIEENKKCFDKINGPLYFLGNYCWVNCGKIIPFELRPYSTELIFCVHNFEKSVQMLGRQMGKCFCPNSVIKIRKSCDNTTIQYITVKDFLEEIKCSAVNIMQDKKFTKEWEIDDYEILTDTGWVDIEKIYETIPYNIWKIRTTNHELECADNHILFRPNYEEVFIKDLKIGDKVITEDGNEEIISIEETNKQVPMYDIALPIMSNHRFYSNGILSHNTTTCCLYAYWLAAFNKDQQILLTSYNYDQTVMKNMATIKTAYEYTPAWLKPGIVKWNEQSIKFDNGSEIIAKTTTEDCVRGTSPNMIYSDELAFTFKGNTNSQKQFYTSISPALSASKGKLCITSTPLSEFDMFASIWQGATRFTDDDGNEIPDIYILRNENNVIVDLHKFNTYEEAEKYNKEHPELEAHVVNRRSVGYNGFTSFKATWRDVPGRTEEWARLERINMGDLMFEREYNCLSGDNCVSIQLPNGEIRNIPLDILYEFYGCNLN